MYSGLPMRWVLTIEAALVGAFIATLFVTLCARVRWRWMQIASALLLALPALLLGLGWVFLVDHEHDGMAKLYQGALELLFEFRRMVMWIVLGCVSTLVVTSLLLPLYALRRRGDDRRPTAHDWSLRKQAMRCAAALALFLVTVLGYALYLGKPVRAARRQALDTAKSLVPPPVADDENAYPLYTAAASTLPASSIVESRLGDDDDPPSEATRAFIQEHLTSLELFSRAVRLPACRIPIDNEEPFANDVERVDEEVRIFLAKVGPLVRLTVRRAATLAADGDLRGALRHFEDLSHLAHQLRSDPRGIVSGYASVLVTSRLHQVEQLLNKTNYDVTQFDTPVRATLDDRGEDLPSVIRWDNAQTEYLWYGIGLPESQAGLIKLPPIARELGLIEARVFSFSDDLYYIPIWCRRFEDAAAASDDTIAAKTNSIDLEFVGHRTDCNQSVLIFFPAKLGVITVRVRATASLGLVDLAIAAAAHRAVHGKYPASLDDLVPEFIDRIPTDPWDGRPLKMLATEGGLVLYSVGHDGTDEGGQLIERRGRMRESDLTFCLGTAFEERSKLPTRGW